MTRRLTLGLLLLLAAHSVLAAQQYAVTGMVVKVDRASKTFTASIQAIPGYMAAMTMPFEVLRMTELDGVAPGATVEFSLVVDRSSSHAEHVRVLRYQSVESDPLTANRLTLLNQIVAGSKAAKPLAVGDAVPDFTLTDQRRRPVTLSELRGKVVAINFIYTSCALPNFCLRIANNFGVLQKRFTQQLEHDLVLLTVTFDPVHDTPDVLAKYAEQWPANPAKWRFLTGRAADVQRVCRMFGVDAFPDEGLMDHSLHTALIDRQGRLAANIEGNQFTAAQLGDLTEAVLR
jgi:protein SCO1/2